MSDRPILQHAVDFAEAQLQPVTCAQVISSLKPGGHETAEFDKSFHGIAETTPAFSGFWTASLQREDDPTA